MAARSWRRHSVVTEAPEAASTAADVFAEWGQLLADRLQDDGINRAAAQSLSTTVVAALEGAVILSRAAQSTKPLEQVVPSPQRTHRPAPSGSTPRFGAASGKFSAPAQLHRLRDKAGFRHIGRNVNLSVSFRDEYAA